MNAVRITDPVFKSPLKEIFIRRARALLGPLARWWLKPQALQQIQEVPADVHQLPCHAPGGCWIILVNEVASTHGGELGESQGLLKPAFVLPLQWKRGRVEHGTNLPRAIRDLATDVVQTLRQEQQIPDHESWGLVLAVDPEGLSVDLSGIDDMGVESGWVSVAMGLSCAIRGFNAKSRIWSTGCYRNGVKPVAAATLAAKVRMAVDAGATRLFVPGSQVSLVEQIQKSEKLKLLVSPLSERPDVTIANGLCDLLRTCEYPESVYIRFSRQLSENQLLAVERDQEVTIVAEHGEAMPIIDDEDKAAYVHQVRQQIARIPLKAKEWEAVNLIVSLPEFAPICGIILAELHGRTGRFPKIVWRLDAKRDYRVAGVIELQEIRDTASKSRST